VKQGHAMPYFKWLATGVNYSLRESKPAKKKEQEIVRQLFI
jgi:hypothetical protein